jgi:outer membrane protein TolC
MPAHRLFAHQYLFGEMQLRFVLAICSLLLAVVGWAGAASAAEPPEAVYRLTIAEAIELAEASSPRLEQLSSLVGAGEAGVDQARAARQPDIDVSARYSRLSDIPEFAIVQPDGSRQVIFPNIPNRYSARLGLSVPLYLGGRIRSGIEAAARLTKAATGDLAAARADLRLEVTDAYLQVVRASEQEGVIAESIAAFDAHLTDVRNRIEYGLAARNEELAVSVERDRAELSRLQAAGVRAVAMANLVRLLGLPPGSTVETVEQLAAAKIDDGDHDLANLVDRALERRSERAAAVSRLQAARAAVEVRRAGTRPAVVAAAGYDLARPNTMIVPPQDQLDDSWNVSINLSYRLFDGGKTRAAVRQAEAEAAAAAHRLEELDRAIRQQVTASLYQLQTARSAVPVAAAGRESAKESLRVARDRYREGLIPSSELLDAEVALLRAGLDHTTALARLRLAMAGLDRAVGG